MLEQQNVKAVQECYAAYGRKDLDKFFACMTPDIDWELTEVPGVSFTGKRKGCEQIAEYFEQFDEKLAIREFTPREFIAQGDKVVVLGHSAWTTKETQNDIESDWVHVFTLRDGRVSAFREYLGSHLGIEFFECAPLAAGTAAGSPAPH
ncbi:nuclear transport factor 2 family protein [Massilia sp. UBA6681]|uniref:nuclear transport factor 2 family protein n=1 Tax=Massilia sp. UBA6681 TaxID=1946839 RepID=UPI0025C33CE3|nr:nuclear transport factor 2 family protein [Massilia sp. UBA6681]